MAVSEGSFKDFIKNFREMSELAKERYGLTKEEAKALNNEHLSQAITNMANTVSMGVSEFNPLLGFMPLLRANLKKNTNAKVDNGATALMSALEKIKNTGITPAGAFNEAFNSNFSDWLRNGGNGGTASANNRTVTVSNDGKSFTTPDGRTMNGIIDKQTLPVFNEIIPINLSGLGNGQGK